MTSTSPSIDLYIEVEGTPELCPDPVTFAKWFDTKRKPIMTQKVTAKVTLTSIFLGVPSAPGLCDVYEARVFGGLGDTRARRASSRAELATVFAELLTETRRLEGLEAVDQMRTGRSGSRWDW